MFLRISLYVKLLKYAFKFQAQRNQSESVCALSATISRSLDAQRDSGWVNEGRNLNE